MDYLKLTLTPNGSYSLTETNSEKLFVLANLLLNKTIRSQLRPRLEDFPEIALGETIHFNFLPDYTFQVRRANEEQLVITLLKKKEPEDESNPLIIDIYIDIILTLLEDFEDLLEDKSPEIYLTLQGNMITAQDSLEPNEQKT